MSKEHTNQIIIKKNEYIVEIKFETFKKINRNFYI